MQTKERGSKILYFEDFMYRSPLQVLFLLVDFIAQTDETLFARHLPRLIGVRTH